MYPAPFKIGRLFGIDLRLDLSVSLLAVLIVFGTYQSIIVFLPGVAPAMAVLAGVAVAVGLLLSILLHEFGHALTGQYFGMDFQSITLFLMGGMASTDQRMPSAKVEFWVAIAGPIVSILLAVQLFVIGLIFFTQVSLVAYCIAYLTTINLMLGIFNMIPAFPLDGGRVLRSMIWKKTGSYSYATTMAAKTGYGFAGFLVLSFVLMLCGITVPFIGGSPFNLLLAWMVWQMAKNEEAKAYD